MDDPMEHVSYKIYYCSWKIILHSSTPLLNIYLLIFLQILLKYKIGRKDFQWEFFNSTLCLRNE
jgi:hypothetical protein